MKRCLNVKPLTPNRIDSAFPVVQAANPGLTLDQWRRFASASAAMGPGEPGIMVVEDERGYVQGLCTYRLQRDIRHGTLLAVTDLVAIGLINGDAAAAALVSALEARAREYGCGVVRLHVDEATEVHPGSPVLHEYLRRDGRHPQSVRLFRPVDLVLD